MEENDSYDQKAIDDLAIDLQIELQEAMFPVLDKYAQRANEVGFGFSLLAYNLGSTLVSMGFNSIHPDDMNSHDMIEELVQLMIRGVTDKANLLRNPTDRLVVIDKGATLQ